MRDLSLEKALDSHLRKDAKNHVKSASNSELKEVFDTVLEIVKCCESL